MRLALPSSFFLSFFDFEILIFKYLCGEPDGRAIADRVNLGPWEEWTLYKVGGAKVALKSVHRKWLCAQPPGHNTEWGGEVCADRRDLGPWEKFDMMPVAGLPFPGAPWWQRVLQIAVDAAPIIIGAV